MKMLIFKAKEGYNIIAPYYDSWYWQRFWQENEKPLLEKWMYTIDVGKGADFGAGSGNSLLPFLKRGDEVDAYDISSNMLSICREKHFEYFNLGRLNFYNFDVRKVKIDKRVYDWIICNRMLSNTESVYEVANVMSKVIKIGGECFISDVHPDHCYTYTNLTIGAFDINIETYKHRKEDVINAFESCGFSVMHFREYRKYEVKSSHLIKHGDDSDPVFYTLIVRYDGK